MRQSQNLYEYLYQALVTQFNGGAYLPGQKFPSQREICLRYNMGITTVRKVMKMLDEHGYIRTTQGQFSVVTYQATPQAHTAFLARRRDEIADAYRGLERIMPVLYREGAKKCKEPELRLLTEIMNNVTDQMELAALYRHANAFFTTVLRPMENQLMMDLELDSENYLHLPYLPLSGVKDPFALTADRLKKWLRNAIAQIEGKRFDAFCGGAAQLFRESRIRVDDYLGALGRRTAAAPQIKQEVPWFRAKGRSELYARLAMTLVRRIVGGEFDERKYLPSIPSLMEEYGVMKDTASRAVALLNTLGFAQTIDKKGTVIVMKGAAVGKDRSSLAEPIVQERLSLFLDALQIVSLTAQSCVSSVTYIPDNLAQAMESKLRQTLENRISARSFQLLINCLISLLPYHSLQNIYEQLDELIVWGHYLQSADEALYPDSSGTLEAMHEVIAALKAQSLTDLPNAFGKAFSRIYQDVCVVISKMTVA